MAIVPRGTINTTSLVVPDLYVQIVPPQNLMLNGVPTNVAGVVGTSAWGPVNQPVITATMADYARSFGAIMPRKHDMGTTVAIAIQQGAQNFRCVRVTDGTDVAAQTVVPGTTVSFTALYTGSLGNDIGLTLSSGSRPGTWRLRVTLPGFQPELFDNLEGDGAAFWRNLADAVNSGQGVQRGASQLVVASHGGATAAPVAFSLILGTESVGTDGATGVTSLRLVGVDVPARSGMYALRGQGCGLCTLVDCDDPTSWVVQAGFGLQEGIYMVMATAAGSTIQSAITTKHQAGLDSYSAKLMFGDWLWWSDQANETVRLVSPQGFVLGRLANLGECQDSCGPAFVTRVALSPSGFWHVRQA